MSNSLAEDIRTIQELLIDWFNRRPVCEVKKTMAENHSRCDYCGGPIISGEPM